MSDSNPAGADPSEVLDFWFREITPDAWFRGGDALDALIRARFARTLERAACGDLDHWCATPLGRVALVIVLDQFSRQIHRGDAAAFAQDAKALALALEAIAAGEDERLTFCQRHFLYMPLMHSEDPDMQRRSVDLFESLRDFAQGILDFAVAHRDDIARFGRFPGRNEALGRPSTEEEATVLDRGNRAY